MALTSRHNCAFQKTQNNTTTADHNESQLLSTLVADGTNCRLVLKMFDTLALGTYTSVLVTSGGSNIVALEPTNQRAGYKTVYVVKGQVAIAPNKPFLALLTNVSIKLIQIAKLKILAHLANSSAHIIVTETALLETDPETIDAVHYIQSIDRDIQITRQKNGEAKGDQKRKLDRKSETQLLDEYEEYRAQLLNLLSEF